ncbi:DNA polymerase IV [Flavobacterium macacae]|uniref:DNA polymerase IV n=1 Tax=Flavobacterium macacae TaxID=2488993 RepID=A0A3P3W8R4_9FLAO|nr:DNA polymerase IV [Flavobacterium macacae]RRJ90737.1 DNA polymerase IV [Flavobacterium macacae]
MGARAVGHIDMDTFFASCEVLANSKLQGLPVIIGNGERGVVASCTYEARRFNVRSGMALKMAKAMCPDAILIKGDMEYYARMSRTITQIIEEKAPVVEKASIDEFYLDVTGMDKFHGTYRWMEELVQLIRRETGLPGSFALSTNKTVAKIASAESKPVGKLQITEDMVQPFLNPLPIRRIPQVGSETAALLTRIGIRTIETLARMPVRILEEQFGKNGRTIWSKANGIDNAPVEPYKEQKSISREQTFESDTIDVSMMLVLLSKMVEELAHQLREQTWLAGTVSVKIKYSDMDTQTRQSSLAYTSANHKLDAVARDLFFKLYTRRIRVRLIGITFTKLVRGTYQINMFEDTEQILKLYLAMDRMKNKHGIHAVTRGVGFDLKMRRR